MLRHTHTTSGTGTVVHHDDGGSGLFDACSKRFDSAFHEVTCDASHTVWVKRRDVSRSVGLSPWMLGRRSLADLLDSVEAKLGPVPGKH
jgi:hypothetical protein